MPGRSGMADELANEWCAGIPLERRRALDDDDTARLLGELRRFRRRAGFALLMLPVWILSLECASITPGGAAVLLLALGAILWIAIPAVQLFIWLDCLLGVRGLRRDLRAGYVKRFAGLTEPACAKCDETYRRLNRARLAPEKPAGAWSIEVLPMSGRVWRINDQLVASWVPARCSSVAEVPEFASVAAQWLEPVDECEQGRLLAGRRDLSTAEIRELRRVGRNLWRRPLPLAGILAIWLAIPGAQLVREHHLRDRPSAVAFWVLLVLALLLSWRFVRSFVFARRIGADAASGYVVILSSEPSAPGADAERKPEAEGAGAAADAGERPPIIEMLPNSRTVWTENGRPAQWRMSDF